MVSQINTKQFQTCFIAWMQDCHTLTEGDVVAGGKTVRRSYDKTKRKGAIHMISAFSTLNGVVLGQMKTGEKSNEVTAILDLLELLELKGCLVTIDAIGCQKNIAAAIIRYYISSRALSAEEFANAIRTHWHIESKLHWKLDVAMNEDDCKIRRGNAAEILPGVRHIALNMLAGEKNFKVGVKRKQKKAAMSHRYLSSVLAARAFS